MSNKFKLFLGVLLIAVGVGRFALADVRPMIVGGGTGTTDLTAVNATLSALSTNKMDKADRSCATGYVLKGITASGTTECVAASSASLPTGTEGQVISYDSSGNAVASTVQELAFSATDFNETVSGTTTTVSLASAGGGTISLTESATDPAYSSMTTGQMIVSKSSGDLFYKSATGGYTFAGVYVVDPATYSLTFTLSGVSGADKLTINGADYTAGTTINGLSGDVAVTGTLGGSTALACTGTGISGSDLSYLASMTEARSMACVFSADSSSLVLDMFTEVSDTLLESHAPDNGNAWVKHPNYPTGSVTVDAAAGRAYASAGSVASAYYNNTTPTDADYTVSADLVVVSEVAGAYSAILLRFSPSSDNYYAAYYAQDVGFWRIEKRIGGTRSDVVTVADTLTTGQTYALEFSAVGTTLTLKVDGVTKLSVADSNITTTGYAGVRMSRGSGSTGYHLDNYMVAD